MKAGIRGRGRVRGRQLMGPTSAPAQCVVRVGACEPHLIEGEDDHIE